MEHAALTLKLDSKRAAKLKRLAKQAEVGTDELANSVLVSFIDEIELGADPATVTAILDSIPGAFESAKEGSRAIDRGEYIDLADL